jgi:hypothetical protein
MENIWKIIEKLLDKYWKICYNVFVNERCGQVDGCPNKPLEQIVSVA